MVSFNPDDGGLGDEFISEHLIKSEVDKALKYLLDHDLISMEWCSDREEMVYYMSEGQKEKSVPFDWDMPD